MKQPLSARSPRRTLSDSEYRALLRHLANVILDLDWRPEVLSKLDYVSLTNELRFRRTVCFVLGHIVRDNSDQHWLVLPVPPPGTRYDPSAFCKLPKPPGLLWDCTPQPECGSQDYALYLAELWYFYGKSKSLAEYYPDWMWGLVEALLTSGRLRSVAGLQLTWC